MKTVGKACPFVESDLWGCNDKCAYFENDNCVIVRGIDSIGQIAESLKLSNSLGIARAATERMEAAQPKDSVGGASWERTTI